MKKDTHPAYQQVLFVDSASGHRFVCGSALQTEARETFEGVEYPVVYLSISSTSHPFFTGSKQLVDSEGRVEKFKKRFMRKQETEGDASSSQEEKKEEKPAAHPKKTTEKEEKPAAHSKKATEKKAAKPPKK